MKKIIMLLSLFISTLAAAEVKDTAAVAFWNLENLFDTVDDSLKTDEEFTPAGQMQWTNERLNTKLNNLARVIKDMDKSGGPDIMGAAEVEHQALLDSIVKRITSKKYKVAYAESPDNRGIDNGLIYNSARFTLVSVKTGALTLPDGYPTRFILNVNLKVNKTKEVIHLFVNHWPSRREGEKESEINRITAAKVLRGMVDELLQKDKNANIIIMGDFNDEPGNVSITDYLKAAPLKCDSLKLNMPGLLNAAYDEFLKGTGSLKYKDDWNLLDQVIVSTGTLSSKKFRYVCGSYKVFKPDYMVTKTGFYAGTPEPTYGGKKYLGGYSDHFPVIAKFLINK